MGIDLKSGGRRKGHNTRTAPVTKNVYVKLLEKLYMFLERRAESKFAGVIVKRLRMSKINNAPISISRLARFKEDKTAVLREVSTLTYMGEKARRPRPVCPVEKDTTFHLTDFQGCNEGN